MNVGVATCLLGFSLISVQGQITGVYLPPGPASPARPPWAGTTRDIPWWFSDSGRASDAYDVSMIWATRYNGGGTGGYEAGIISPPSPLGNQGTYSNNPDRTWTSGTSYPFTISYTWTGTDTTGTGVASFTINGATSTANPDVVAGRFRPGYVTDRVRAFANGTAPTLGGATGSYQEPHLQRDLLIRLATDIPGASSSSSIGVSGLSIMINGGAPQAMNYENGGTQTALTVAGSPSDTVRQIGFLYFDDLFANYTDDFVLSGTLTHNVSGPTPNVDGSRLMFEVKIGDLDLNQSPIPEPSTWAGGVVVVLGSIAVWMRRRTA